MSDRPTRRFTNGRGEGREGDGTSGRSLTSWTHRDAMPGRKPSTAATPPGPPRVFVQDSDFTLYVGDVRDCLRELPDQSVHTVVTSPPYWGLRDYGTDGQIGLEATPDEFVTAMVDVFREVRRVLRDDGTLWLNLGDSYAGSVLTRPFKLNDGVDAQADLQPPPSRDVPLGLKPKDLVGIPWRLAFALQQPYYTGRIKDERDRIWLAAMIDAEGCIFIHKRKVGQSNGQGYDRKSDTYGSGLEVSNTNREIVERVMAIVGKGSISTSTRGRNQPLYRWNLRSNECRDVLCEVYPHLVSKQQQARLAIFCPSSGADAEKAHASLIALHNGEAATIDFTAPSSLFEPGWYLRSDVIWSKSNPMPESVTDRPTKAHEYVFLLSKSPRYFFDQEAVRESGKDWSKGGPGVGIATTEHYGAGNGGNSGLGALAGRYKIGDVAASRNVRSVWEIATQPYPEAHFATFPEALPERCIKAGTSERGCCPECGAPWERVVTATGPDGRSAEMRNGKAYDDDGNPLMGDNMIDPGVRGSFNSGQATLKRETSGWRPTCECVASKDIEKALIFRPDPCTVLDPFMGSGTTALVARRLGRKSIGVELNPEYSELCARRLQQLSLLA